MPARILKAFLDQEQVRYVTIVHSRAYTAQEIAASAHIPGREIAKTVIVRLDGKMAMAVLPADHRLHFGLLRKIANVDVAELADEAEFKDLFPECEAGAMPPFGNLYDMPVFVEESLTKDHEIAFNAGSHTELIRLAYSDFERLVHPTVLPAAA